MIPSGQVCMTITIDLPSELQERLHEEAERAGVGDSEFALSAITERLAGSEAKLSDAEAALLREIDRGFSDEWWSRYAELVHKREDESLSGDEHQELTVLTGALEEYNVRRIACLAEAAKRHGVALEDLMAQLDIKPRDLG